MFGIKRLLTCLFRLRCFQFCACGVTEQGTGEGGCLLDSVWSRSFVFCSGLRFIGQSFYVGIKGCERE